MTDRNDLAHEGTEPEAAHRPPVITAAWIVFAGLIIAGLMVWQPWASVKEQELTRGNGGYKVTCLVYKETFRCP